MTALLAGQLVLGIYAILLAIGGLIGFLKAGSRPSLIAGGLSALIALACLGLSVRDPRPRNPGFYAGAFLALALTAFFGARFARGRKFMPGGLMTLVSLATLVTLVVLIARATV